MSIAEKIGLGTAQFGLDYGISNETGKVQSQQIKEILLYAALNNIGLVDTAGNYGSAEKELGACLQTDTNKFDIVTKVSFDAAGKEPVNASKQLKKSLEYLRAKSVYAVLAHHADELLSKNGAEHYAQLLALKTDHKTAKIGVSVYTSAQAQAVIANYDIDIIQFPLNLLDQRLTGSGLLSEFKQRNIEIHVRSVFLQGLLLERELKLPQYFSCYQSQLNHYWQSLDRLGISGLEAALSYVYSIQEIDKILVGVVSVAQLEQIIRTAMHTLPPNFIRNMQCDDPNLINPALWRVG